jgi:hypothetical protein
MSQNLNLSNPLNDVQMMLLRLFSRPMSKNDQEAIRNLLLDYYKTELQKEVDETIKKKNITRKDFDEILNKQQRSK